MMLTDAHIGKTLTDMKQDSGAKLNYKFKC